MSVHACVLLLRYFRSVETELLNDRELYVRAEEKNEKTSHEHTCTYFDFSGDFDFFIRFALVGDDEADMPSPRFAPSSSLAAAAARGAATAAAAAAAADADAAVRRQPASARGDGWHSDALTTRVREDPQLYRLHSVTLQGE
jgi:hypothetical protein